MSFKTLEDRFNEKVNDIYAAAQLKFEGGLPSTGRFDDPLLTRRPGDGQFGLKQEGRSLPFTSAPRDLKRITLFTLSPSGLLFLAKQQLLQTGNTFAHTRVINPAFAVGNTIPFLHLKRNLRITRELFGKTDTSTENLRKMGGLQRETYDSFASQDQGILGRIGRRLLSPITNTISAFTSERTVYDGTEDTWRNARPELGEDASKYVLKMLQGKGTFKYGGKIYTENFTKEKYNKYGLHTNNKYYFREGLGAKGVNDYAPATFKWILGEYATDQRRRTTIDINEDFYFVRSGKIQPVQEDSILTEIEAGRQAYQNKIDEQFEQEYNNAPDGKKIDQSFKQLFSAYFSSDDNLTITRDNSNARDIAKGARDSIGDAQKKLSYIKDPLNKPAIPIEGRLETAYSDLPTVSENNRSNDPIIVSFAMGKADSPAVQFRAFLTELKEDISPQYNEQQYIGRIEKFITYSGVQRSVSFNLAVIAFSQDELQTVWKRINYLSGMAFPYGFNKGIMQPNIIRMSIGNVYRDQPGYITSLSKDFNNPSESWDIDYEVPIGAMVSLSFNIIEKATRIASSPLYGINEQSSRLFRENKFVDSLTSPNVEDPI